MSDDEEIICQGRDLYTHLINQGFDDFETFSPIVSEAKNSKSSLINSPKLPGTNRKNQPNFKLNDDVTLSSNVYEMLNLIIASQLLFKEDVDIIETAMESYCVRKAKSKWFWFVTTLAGLVSSVSLCTRGNKVYLFSGVTFALPVAIFSFWNCCKEAIGAWKNVKLRCHIDTLQSLCSDVHKILRFLKEAEILSGCKVQSQNVCAAFYIPIPVTTHGSPNNSEIDRPTEYSWQLFPHLRKCLLDSLNEVINILDVACNDLKQLPHPDVRNGQPLLNETQRYHVKDVSDLLISLKELQLLDEKYLNVQSEYLKLVSFNLCPALLNSPFKFKNNTLHLSKIFNNLELKLKNISFQLKMQYHVHNINPSTKNTRSMAIKALNVNSEEICNLQAEVHNIFLLMLSMLLRVKSVEDYLENISSSNLNENHNDLKATVDKTLYTLKDDLTKTLSCYDLLYKQVVTKMKIHDHDTRCNNITSSEDISEIGSNIKMTGIVVGSTDFTVNSPDEVFLAISCFKSQEHESDDDVFFEKKPKIPQDLLSELSNRLKTRKKNFSEREKAALERQGQHDFDARSVSSEESDETLSTNNIIDKSFGFNGSTDSEETYLKKVPYQPLKKIRKNEVNSDSDVSVTDDEMTPNNSHPGNLPELNQLSLANQVAMKSQLWGNRSEEFFSDG